MTTADVKEAAALLRAILAALVLTGDQSTEAGAILRQACGEATASAAVRIQAGEVGQAMLACFRAAYEAGASLDEMDRIRGLVMASGANGWPAKAVQQGALRMALAQQVKILAGTSFRSRAETDALMRRMAAAFEPAETFAADQLDQASWRSIVDLHAVLTQDLQRRGKTLPQIVRIDFVQRMPALAIANRLYGDAGRSGELVEENAPVHPLFMPPAVSAYSA